MIQICNLKKSYKDKIVLDEVSLNLPDKGLFLITGVSGSGKTTLLNIIAGIDRGYSGIVKVGNTNIYELNNNKLAGYRNSFISYIKQEDMLIDDYTILENIDLSLKINKIKLDIDKLNKLLKKVNLDNVLDKYPHQLSGGMRQRINIVRSLMKESKIILCDEITSALDKDNSKIIASLLKEEACDKLVIVVSHNNYFQEVSDSVIEIKDTKLISSYYYQNSFSLNTLKLESLKVPFSLIKYTTKKFVKKIRIKFVLGVLLLIFSLIGNFFIRDLKNLDHISLISNKLKEDKALLLQLTSYEKESLGGAELTHIVNTKEESISLFDETYKTYNLDYKINDKYLTYLYELETKQNTIDYNLSLKNFSQELIEIYDIYITDYIADSLLVENSFNDYEELLNYKILIGQTEATIKGIVETDYNILNVDSYLGYVIGKENSYNYFNDNLGFNLAYYFNNEKVILKTKIDDRLKGQEVIISDNIKELIIDNNQNLALKISSPMDLRLDLREYYVNIINLVKEENTIYVSTDFYNKIKTDIGNISSVIVKLDNNIEQQLRYYYNNGFIHNYKHISNKLIALNDLFNLSNKIIEVFSVILLIIGFIIINNVWINYLTEQKRIIKVLSYLGLSIKNICKVYFSQWLLLVVLVIGMSVLTYSYIINSLNKVVMSTLNISFKVINYSIINVLSSTILFVFVFFIVFIVNLIISIKKNQS